MKDLARNLRFGLRMLLRNPTTTVISLVTLALGIGASTAVFSIVDTALLTPLPFEEPDRLVRLFTAKPSAGWNTMTVSLPDHQDWTNHEIFESAGIFAPQPVNVMGREHPDRLIAMRASAGVLETLRVQPVIGRFYDASSDDPAAPPVVLLSDATWRSHFAADPDVVGTTMRIDDVPYEVLGVLPPEVESGIGRPFDLWAPFTFGERAQSRSQRSFASIARLKDGVSVEEADRAIKVVAERLAETYPDSNRGHTMNVRALTDVLLNGTARSVLFALSAAVAFVLLIACVNITNLLLATAGSREREFAVRAALGADSNHLARQLLTEAALLTVIGGALGVAVAYWSIDLLAAGLQTTIDQAVGLAVDSRALAFAVVVLGITSLGIGLPVALRVSRSRFSSVIRESTRSSSAGPRALIRRDLLVVTQVALALALMISAGLMIRSLLALKSVDPGFDTENLLTMRVSLPADRYPTEAERIEFFQRAEAEIRSLPGVISVACSGGIPLIGDTSNSFMTFEDHPVSDPADRVFVGNHAATPGYLATMGITLLEGREFTPLDTADSQPVILINNRMARKFWPDESALGKRVKFGSLDNENPWMEVVGVMADYRQTALDTGPRYETLYPQALFPSPAMTFVIRTEGPPGLLADPARQAIWKIGPSLGVYRIATMDEILADNVRSADDLASLLGGFGVVALILALGGLYGMMSFSVGQRTQEIGVRMALGAQSRTVLGTVLARAAMLITGGVLVGGLVAWLLSRWLQGVLFETSSLDPVTYLAVCAGMLAVGLVAGLVPACRASRVDPVIALRHE